MTEKESLMKKLMIYSFAVTEWNLYLDTHPYDQDAITTFHSMVKAAKEAREEYERKCGPITATASKDTEFFDWIECPWPWEKY